LLVCLVLVVRDHTRPYCDSNPSGSGWDPSSFRSFEILLGFCFSSQCSLLQATPKRFVCLGSKIIRRNDKHAPVIRVD
jgi:hypothetical protein